jgi:hypothetical protein
VSLALIHEPHAESLGLSASVGASAGIGLALKPHFVLAWALVEVTAAAYDRRPRQLVRIEVLVAAAVVIAYTASVVLFAPGYPALLREWGPLYLRWLSTPLRILVVQPECVVSVAVLLLALTVRGAGVAGHTAFVFGIASSAFAVAVLVQGKGFSYHWYPAMAFATISLAASLRALEIESAGRGKAAMATAIGVVLLLVTAARMANGLVLGNDRRRLETAIEKATNDAHRSMHRDGDRLAILSTRLVDAFPMVVDLDLHWSQRWPSLRVLEAAAPTACANPPKTEDRVRVERVQDDLLTDLRAAQPQTIIVQPIPPSMHRRDGCRSLSDHLARDPRFAALFADYEPHGTIPNGADDPFTVLRRRGARLEDAPRADRR